MTVYVLRHDVQLIARAVSGEPWKGEFKGTVALPIGAYKTFKGCPLRCTYGNTFSAIIQTPYATLPMVYLHKFLQYKFLGMVGKVEDFDYYIGVT